MKSSKRRTPFLPLTGREQAIASVLSVLIVAAGGSVAFVARTEHSHERFVHKYQSIDQRPYRSHRTP